MEGLFFFKPEPGTAARRFLYSSICWLLLPGVFGLVLASLLYLPELHDRLPMAVKPYLSFGRLRPTHVNLAVFGWLSMVYCGAILYILPRLTRAPLYSERLAQVNAWLWNLMMVGVLVTLPMGLTQGREYAELIWPLDLLFVANMVLLGINIWGTVLNRQERKIYVTLWNFMAAVVIMLPIYAVGNKIWDPSGAYSGMNDNIINYFYVHNLFNAWFTTAGIGLALYLLPRLTDKPLYSHRLGLWGLWSVFRARDVLVYPGGTLAEYAIVQGVCRDYMRHAVELGFNGIEISDGTIDLAPRARRDTIRFALDLGLTVVTEIGKKDPGKQPPIEVLAEQALADFDAGASWVTVEARESGRGVGVFDEDGTVVEEDVERLAALLAGRIDRIVWESPLKRQQDYFIHRFGPNVCLGNIQPRDVLALEALRAGLRFKTFRTVAEQLEVTAEDTSTK